MEKGEISHLELILVCVRLNSHLRSACTEHEQTISGLRILSLQSLRNPKIQTATKMESDDFSDSSISSSALSDSTISRQQGHKRLHHVEEWKRKKRKMLKDHNKAHYPLFPLTPSIDCNILK